MDDGRREASLARNLTEIGAGRNRPSQSPGIPPFRRAGPARETPGATWHPETFPMETRNIAAPHHHLRLENVLISCEELRNKKKGPPRKEVAQV